MGERKRWDVPHLRDYHCKCCVLLGCEWRWTTWRWNHHFENCPGGGLPDVRTGVVKLGICTGRRVSHLRGDLGNRRRLLGGKWIRPAWRRIHCFQDLAGPSRCHRRR